MNKEVISISENELDTQVIGESFRAGAKDLAEIRRKLKLRKAEAPDYLSSHSAAVEALVALGQHPYVRVTNAGKFVCIFEHEGGPAVTTPQESASAAATCALHFVLTSK